MDVRHLQTFDAIVKAGSFVGAAEKLGYSQSTITVQVQALERELGMPLFARDAKRLTLTEAGRLFGDHVNRMLESLDLMRQAMDDLRSGDAGLVRIAAIDPAASRLAPIFSNFMRHRPKARIVLEGGGTNSVAKLVAAGVVDVGLSSHPPAQLGLTFEPLYVEEQSVLLPANHPLASRAKIRAKDVMGTRVLLTDQHCHFREMTENGFMSRGLHIEPSMEIGNYDALRRAVQNGLGIAIMPARAATPLPEGTVLRPLEGVKVGLPIGLVRRADAGPPGRALQLLIEEIREGLADRGHRDAIA
jgi:DNA-binding transcriptional LysR family regulator